jgi:hypothetical protein
LGEERHPDLCLSEAQQSWCAHTIPLLSYLTFASAFLQLNNYPNAELHELARRVAVTFFDEFKGKSITELPFYVRL